MSEILDSGARTQFYDKNGNAIGVRDMKDGRGRMDLLPLDIISNILKYRNDNSNRLILSEDNAFIKFNSFIRQGNTDDLYEVLQTFINREYNGDFEKAIMELSIHYEQGARKYAERNWEKGIPCHSFVDSALRHAVKYFRGDDDEPHNRAFMWNIVGLLWTINHHPELNDLPYNKKEDKVEVVEESKEDKKEDVVVKDIDEDKSDNQVITGIRLYFLTAHQASNFADQAAIFISGLNGIIGSSLLFVKCSDSSILSPYPSFTIDRATNSIILNIKPLYKNYDNYNQILPSLLSNNFYKIHIIDPEEAYFKSYELICETENNDDKG